MNMNKYHLFLNERSTLYQQRVCLFRRKFIKMNKFSHASFKCSKAAKYGVSKSYQHNKLTMTYLYK